MMDVSKYDKEDCKRGMGVLLIPFFASMGKEELKRINSKVDSGEIVSIR